MGKPTLRMVATLLLLAGVGWITGALPLPRGGASPDAPGSTAPRVSATAASDPAGAVIHDSSLYTVEAAELTDPDIDLSGFPVFSTGQDDLDELRDNETDHDDEAAADSEADEAGGPFEEG